MKLKKSELDSILEVGNIQVIKDPLVNNQSEFKSGWFSVLSKDKIDNLDVGSLIPFQYYLVFKKVGKDEFLYRTNREENSKTNLSGLIECLKERVNNTTKYQHTENPALSQKSMLEYIITKELSDFGFEQGWGSGCSYVFSYNINLSGIGNINLLKVIFYDPCDWSAAAIIYPEQKCKNHSQLSMAISSRGRSPINFANAIKAEAQLMINLTLSNIFYKVRDNNDILNHLEKDVLICNNPINTDVLITREFIIDKLKETIDKLK